MKAVIIDSFGGPEVLHTTADWPIPQPKSDEVLIKVYAAGVNPVDYKIRAGHFRRETTELPTVLGRDVSGTIEAVGDSVSDLRPGDEVFAFLASGSGGYADYAVAKSNEVALKPRTIGHTHAAAVPLAAVTAWQALFDYGHLRTGQRVLIHGAAGGVGHFAVQFAKAIGATVIVTVGPEDIELMHEFGADQVINYKETDFEQETSGIDLVIDLIAGETQERSWNVLHEGGTLVSTLEQPSGSKAAEHHARGISFMAKPTHEMLKQISQLIDDGKVQVRIQKTYGMDDAALAQDELEHEHSRGKRVLVIT